MENTIQEEVYKCSKCALCQSVCPLYLAFKNEMFLSRGRYIILNNFYINKKELSKTFIKNLDICLNCNACKNFCPSNIDAYKVFTKIKSEKNYKFSLFHFSTIYFLVLNILRIYNLVSGALIQKKSTLDTGKIKGKVVYFEGCYNKFIDSADKNASLNIIEKLGYEVTVCSNCCGYPFLNEGNLRKFESNKKKIIEKIDSNCDYIVCSCDSCFDSLKKTEEISDKLITLDEFVKLNNLELLPCNNVVYHKPLLREKNCYLPQTVKTLNRKGACSLMENFFILKYKKLAKIMLREVFYSQEELSNYDIITTCNLAKWGLTKCLREKKYSNKVFSYSEFIEKNI